MEFFKDIVVTSVVVFVIFTFTAGLLDLGLIGAAVFLAIATVSAVMTEAAMLILEAIARVFVNPPEEGE